MKKQNVVILGSTGSIGSSTLEVIKLNNDKYNVFALVANSNIEKLFNQCLEYKPQYAVILDKNKADDLQYKLNNNDIGTIVFCNDIDIINLVEHSDTDIVMSAIVGSKGLLSTYAAIKANKKVLLANKESLITGGKLIIDALAQSHATLIPVDSEHNAIFQCLYGGLDESINQVSRIILTASGGPFLDHSIHALKNVSVEEALKHPNWLMGKKITIDSSTLMNKGLEVIEAYWLFGQNLSKIDVIIHPQSIIHSMVEYEDSSILAQLGSPDMKTPIAYALAYPKRIISGSKKLDFTTISNLTFYPPDYTRFPCLQLAFNALVDGGAMPAILNAANEVAVEAFLERKIGFYGISETIKKAMYKFGAIHFNSIDEVIAIDTEVRHFAYDSLS